MLAEATAPCYDQLLRAVDGLAAPPSGAIAWMRSCLSGPTAATRTHAPLPGDDHRPFDYVDAAKRVLPIVATLPPPSPDLALPTCESVLIAGITSVLDGPRQSWNKSAPLRFVSGVAGELGGIVLAGLSPKSAARAERLAIQTGMDRHQAQRATLGVDEWEICRRLAESWGLELPPLDAHTRRGGFLPSSAREDTGRYFNATSSVPAGRTAREDAGRYISDRDAGFAFGEGDRLDDLVQRRMDDIHAALDLAEFARRWSAGVLIGNDLYADSPAIEAGQTAFITRDFAQVLSEHLDSLSPTASAAACCRSTAAWFRAATGAAEAICAIQAGNELNAATDRLILSPRPRSGFGAHPSREASAGSLQGPASPVRTTLQSRHRQTDGTQCDSISRILTDDLFHHGLNRASERMGRRLLGDAGLGADGSVWLLRFGAPGELTGIVLLAEPSPRSIASVAQQPGVITGLLRRTFEAIFTRIRAKRRADFASRPSNPRGGAAAPSGVTATQILSRLAAGAAHELNNPLAVISGRAQMLLANTAEGDDARALRTICEQARRASDMVNELVETAKPPAPDPEPIRLADWVERMRQYWFGVAGNDAGAFDTHLADPNVRVWADPDQLDTVSEAILDNARQYAKSENVHLSINSTGAESDESIVLSVRDDGVGMTPATAAHAFDPFYSQREAGRGRGLGLTRALRLVEVNGGRMWIKSRCGVGTTIHVALPSMASRPRSHRRNT